MTYEFPTEREDEQYHIINNWLDSLMAKGKINANRILSGDIYKLVEKLNKGGEV